MPILSHADSSAVTVLCGGSHVVGGSGVKGEVGEIFKMYKNPCQLVFDQLDQGWKAWDDLQMGFAVVRSKRWTSMENI